jgi:hypothetical protein
VKAQLTASSKLIARGLQQGESSFFWVHEGRKFLFPEIQFIDLNE